MAVQNLRQSNITPTYAAASGNVPARQVAGQISVYQDAVRSFIKAHNLMDQLFGRTSRVVNKGAGRGFPIHYQNVAGHGARNTLGTPVLPEYRGRDMQYAFVDTKGYYAQFTINGQYLQRSKNSANTPEWLADNVDMIMQSLSNDIIHAKNVQMFGDGRGVLGRVVTSTPGATSTVTVAHWADFASQGLKGATYYLTPNTSIVFIDPTTYARKFVTYITDVDENTGTLTLADNTTGAGIAASDLIVRGDAGGDDFIPFGGSQTVFPDGIMSMFLQDPVFSGIYSGAYAAGTGKYLEVYFAGTPGLAAQRLVPQWRPFVFTNSGTPRPYSPDLIVEAFQRAKNETRLDMGSPNLILSSTDVWLEHWKNYKDRVYFASYETDMGAVKPDMPVFADAGTPLPWMTANLAIPGTITLLNTKTWELLVDDEFTFQPGSAGIGGNLTWMPNTDAYVGWGRGYWNMFCVSPRSNALITDVQVTGRTLNA